MNFVVLYYYHFYQMMLTNQLVYFIHWQEIYTVIGFVVGNAGGPIFDHERTTLNCTMNIAASQEKLEQIQLFAFTPNEESPHEDGAHWQLTGQVDYLGGVSSKDAICLTEVDDAVLDLNVCTLEMNIFIVNKDGYSTIFLIGNSCGASTMRSNVEVIELSYKNNEIKEYDLFIEVYGRDEAITIREIAKELELEKNRYLMMIEPKSVNIIVNAFAAPVNVEELFADTSDDGLNCG